MTLGGAFWRRILSPIYRYIMCSRTVKIARGLIVYGKPIIETVRHSRIQIGSRAVLCSKSKYTALGVSKPCVLRTIKAGAVIDIGDDCGMSGVTIVAAESVKIGSECMFGADVLIVDTDFHSINPTKRRFETAGVQANPVVIGTNVFIGARSVVLKGANIGDNSVIGAGSVVVGHIPPNTISAGHPAKIKRLL